LQCCGEGRWKEERAACCRFAVLCCAVLCVRPCVAKRGGQILTHTAPSQHQLEFKGRKPLTVCGLCLHRAAIRRDQHRGHEAEGTVAL
jgi:hypothetical protein